MKISIKYTVLSIMAVSFLYLPPVYAADSTPSADIKIKLKELQKEIASKAAKLKVEVGRKLKNRAYVGKLKTNSSKSLTLATKTGPKIVSINQDTILPKKKMVEEDYLASLGDVDETGVLTAKKIIQLPTPNSELKTYLWGQIISISDKLATLKTKQSKSVAISLPNGSKVKLNDFVILTGTSSKNDIFKTGFVYVIPQGGIIKPKNVATSSAKVATKSATPSAKKKSP